jgi:hypothetical protein
LGFTLKLMGANPDFKGGHQPVGAPDWMPLPALDLQDAGSDGIKDNLRGPLLDSIPFRVKPRE